MGTKFPTIRLEPFDYAYKWFETEHPRNFIDRLIEAVPEKRRENRLIFIVYSITNKATGTTFKRRYDEFERLYDNLTKMYPCICVPKLPPKKIIKNDENVIRHRAMALPYWLNYVTSHPIMSYDDCVLKFCSDAKISEWNNPNNWPPTYKKKYFYRRIIPSFCATTSTFKREDALFLHETMHDACEILEELESRSKMSNIYDTLDYARQLLGLADCFSGGLIPARNLTLNKLIDVAKEIDQCSPCQLNKQMLVMDLSREIFQKLKTVTYLAVKAFNENNHRAHETKEDKPPHCVTVTACVTAEYNFVVEKQITEFIMPIAKNILKRLDQDINTTPKLISRTPRDRLTEQNNAKRNMTPKISRTPRDRLTEQNNAKET